MVFSIPSLLYRRLRILRWKIQWSIIDFLRYVKKSRAYYRVERYIIKVGEGVVRMLRRIHDFTGKHEIFYYHGYKEMRWVRQRVKIDEGVYVYEEVPEPPEVYKKRKKNIYNFMLFGFRFTVRIPWR